MQSESTPVRDQARQAAALLRRAAHPDRRHLGWAIVWLVIAAGLEVLGPLLGKQLIDTCCRTAPTGPAWGCCWAGCC
jgi:hypothetical protein